MKYTDMAQFTGKCKAAVQQWADKKIDELFPYKPQLRVFAKRGVDNILTRYDTRINKALDTAMLFVADGNGCIDSDVMVDTVVALFNEMEVQKYTVWGMDVGVGRGAVTINFPHNMVFDMLLGNLGQVKFTADDFLELKDLLA